MARKMITGGKNQIAGFKIHEFGLLTGNSNQHYVGRVSVVQ